jgi:hypothetical protein
VDEEEEQEEIAVRILLGGWLAGLQLLSCGAQH